MTTKWNVVVLLILAGSFLAGCGTSTPTTQSPQEYKKGLQDIEKLQPHAASKSGMKGP